LASRCSRRGRFAKFRSRGGHGRDNRFHNHAGARAATASATERNLATTVVISIFACGLVILITGVRLTWAMSHDQRFPGW
jgi:hypothetical protein